MLDGNEDAAGSSDLIETIYAWDVNSEFSPFVDANHALDGTILINGNFRADRVALSPFFDRRLIRNVASGSYYLTASVALTPVEVALSPMTGSTDNYIASGERSATCGWDYDSNTSIGTDSLAFGGFRY